MSIDGEVLRGFAVLFGLSEQSGYNPPMSSPNKEQSNIRRGLVLSGGAALGAYQAGALQVIAQYGVTFEVIAATSIGVLHALAWNRGIVDELDEHWRENVSKLNPFDAGRLLKGQNPFRFRGARDELFAAYREDQPQPDESDVLPILVSLTEGPTGANAMFNLSDPDLTREERELIAKAATTIPPLGDQAVEIRGKRYYDGGFSNNVPVDFLADRDLDEIWVAATLSPRVGNPYRRAAWRATRRVRKQAKHPWLLGATGLLEQYYDPSDLTEKVDATVLIRPDSIGFFRLQRAMRALTFSRRNIEAMLQLGRADADRACREYLAKH